MAGLGPLEAAIPVQVRAPQLEHPTALRTCVRMASPPRGHPEDVSTDELHWLAGLLEGEGSFLAGPPSAPRYPLMTLQMIDEDVVGRVATMFGRKVGRWQPRNPRFQPIFIARITGAKAVSWMTALRPLMGARRQTQIDHALASYAPTPASLLDDTTACEALRLLANGSSVREVAEHFGTSVWCIYDLRLGRTHKGLPRS